MPLSLPEQALESFSLSERASSKNKKLWSLLSLELFLPSSSDTNTDTDTPHDRFQFHNMSGLHLLYHRFYTTHPKGKYPLSQLSPVFGTQVDEGHFQWLCIFDSEAYKGSQNTHAILHKMRRQIRQAYPFLFPESKSKSHKNADLGPSTDIEQNTEKGTNHGKDTATVTVNVTEKIRFFPQAFISNPSPASPASPGPTSSTKAKTKIKTKTKTKTRAETSPPFQTSVPNLYSIEGYERAESAFSPWHSLQQLPQRLLSLTKKQT